MFLGFLARTAVPIIVIQVLVWIDEEESCVQQLTQSAKKTEQMQRIQSSPIIDCKKSCYNKCGGQNTWNIFISNHGNDGISCFFLQNIGAKPKRLGNLHHVICYDIIICRSNIIWLILSFTFAESKAWPTISKN